MPRPGPLQSYLHGERASPRSCGILTELVQKGEDFATVWTSVLNSHALVNGLPESKLEGNRPMLEIKLITGERLVFDSESKKFRVA